MNSKDFKKLALSQLRGKWGRVILALLVPVLVIAAVGAALQIPVQLYTAFHNMVYNGRYTLHYTPASAFFWIISYAGAILGFVLSAVFSYGIAKFLLTFIRRGDAPVGETFSGITSGGEVIGRSILLTLLISVFTFLWSLLFVIPGIIASYRYAMAFYILADNDDMTAMDALRASKEMMRGNKWKLFKLELSFIGWIILSALTLGIGYIFLMPYMNAATADFYEYLRGINDNRRDADSAAVDPTVI